MNTIGEKDTSLEITEPKKHHSKFHYAMSLAYKCFVLYTVKKVINDLK